MEIKELVDKVVAHKNKTITDEVFLLIQDDRDFMQEYLELIREHGIGTVNPCIGRMVKQKYGLTADDQQNLDPKSTLISKHQKYV